MHSGELGQPFRLIPAGVGYEPVGDVEDAASITGVLRAGALCTDARILPPSGGEGW